MLVLNPSLKPLIGRGRSFNSGLQSAAIFNIVFCMERLSPKHYMSKPETGKPLGFCGGHFSSVRRSHETLAGVGLLGHGENMGLPEF